MKISVIAGRYAISGVPLAQLRLARALAAKGHDVDLMIGHVNQGYTMPVVDGINVHVLNKQRVMGMLFPMIRYFRNCKPDVVFAAGDHLSAVVLLAAICSKTRAKISCSSRVTPYDTYSNIPFTKNWILKLVMRAVMPRADALTCVSKDMVKQYRSVFNAPPHVCVYNIIVDAHSQAKMHEPVNEEWLTHKKVPVLVAAGSLVAWKGFSDLIMAMRELVKTREARLLILGDGPLRDELQALINEFGLSDKIKLVGYVDNPLKYFSRADIFVLSSHVEGMPNVLVEAMMCGCTPVSTNCPTGPRELLQDGKYGYLVPVRDPSALAIGMGKAIDYPVPVERLCEAVRPFAEGEVIKRHFDILGIGIQN